MKMILFKGHRVSLKSKLLLSLVASSCLIVLSSWLVMHYVAAPKLDVPLILIWVGTVILSVGLLYKILDHLILKRLAKINSVIKSVGVQSAGLRVGYLGDDQVGQLAAKLDEMLAYEEYAESELKNQAKTYEQLSEIRTHELARQSEALQTLFKSVEQGIGVFDKDLNLIACNDQWRAHLHLPQSYAKQGTSLESICRWNAKNGFLGEGDPEELTQNLFSTYLKREPRVFLRKFDDDVICEITVLPTIVGGLVFTVSDVTDIKRVEAELKKANELLEQRVEERTHALREEIVEHKHTEKALLESQTRLRRAQKISQIGYWGWGLSSGRTYISEEYPRILGLEQEQAPKNQDDFNKLLHPDDFERVTTYFEYVSMTEPQSFEIDYRIVRPQGDVRYIREIGELMYDENGQPEGHTGTIQDITNTKEFEKALMAAKEEAEVANRTKSEFLANMSHELRTPLNAIIGFSDILKEETFGPLNSEKYMEYVWDIRESGGHLLEVLNDILDMSKIEAGEVQLDEDTFHVADEITRSLRFVNEKVMRKKIALEVNYETPSMLLYADRRIFKQIFLNLFSNSLKFTDDRGKITVTVHYLEDRSIELCVEDTGIGIAENDIHKVLLPFGQVQTSHARNFEGTGLGLSLVQNFVALHQGKLKIESILGQGTKVSITFPKERTVDAV